MSVWIIDIALILLTIAVYVVGIIIFLENRSPHRTLFWFLVLAFLPVIGLIAYVFFGRKASRYKFFSKMNQSDIPFLKEKLQKKLELPDSVLGDKKRLAKIIMATSPSQVTLNNDCRILLNGKEKFDAVFTAIETARHHIHLEYFIVKNDKLGSKLKNLLVKKARQGVKVRFLYDGLGSRNLGRRYLAELKEANISAAAFQPFTFPVPSTWLNYRNHRKILLVDGEIGFLGGLNIGDEYLDGGRFDSWRDTHLELKGDCLDYLQGVFVSDWEYVTNEKIYEPALFPQRKPVGEQAVQIAPSGPDGNWEAIHHAYFTAIVTSRDRVFINTPYLILDESIAAALKSAALSGVDVRIIFPGTPDHRIVYWASLSYFTELLEAGVKIYLYQKGFMHAKTLIVDGQVAVVGTANMDMRSFYYSFEINAFIYNSRLAEEMEICFREDLTYSIEVNKEEFFSRPVYVKAKESAARLISPLL